MGRFSGGCGEVVWMIWGGCLESVGKLSEGCGEAVWRVCGGCLEGVGGYLKGVGGLYGECEEDDWMVWEAVWRL